MRIGTLQYCFDVPSSSQFKNGLMSYSHRATYDKPTVLTLPSFWGTPVAQIVVENALDFY